MNNKTPKVTGIGGIFFRCTNPNKIKAWYGTNLELAIDKYGSLFEFRNTHRPEEINCLHETPLITYSLKWKANN